LGFYQLFKMKIVRPDPAINQVLNKHIKLYRHLNAKHKYKFYLRCHIFQNQMEFIPRNGFQLQKEHRFLISAAYVKLTFGRSYKPLSEFSTILIYPEAYYSRITRKKHKGEVNRAGIIVLSWQDFQSDWINETDNMNLGLHEFSHVMVIESEMNQAHSDFNSAFQRWSKLVKQKNIGDKYLQSEYFRPYANTNFVELFAVMTECFFETPHEFQERFPGMYGNIKSIYAIDPLRIYNHPQNLSLQ